MLSNIKSCWSILVLEKTLETPLDSSKIKSIHPKENQSWIFIGGIDAEAEASILWPPDAKRWLIGKDPDAGKIEGRRRNETTDDEMVGWHHWFNGPEFEQTLGDSEGQGSLGLLQSMGSQIVRDDWATKQQQKHVKLKHSDFTLKQSFPRWGVWII